MSDLNRVVELIKAEDKSQARVILLDILADDRQNEQAWLYLAACAENKTEFEQSILRVLALNPYNGQALRLAKSNKIDLPAAVKASQKQEKKRRRAQRKASSGSSQTRLLLYILLLLVIGGGAYLWLQDTTDLSDDAAPAEVAEGEATATPTEEPTPTETPIPTATPSETPVPTAENPADYVTALRVMAGSEDSADDLLAEEVFGPGAALNVVIDVADRSEALTLTIDLMTLTGAAQNVTIEQTVEVGTAETIIIPVSPSGAEWSPGNWAAQVQINGESVPGVQFRIAAPSTVTPEPSEAPATNAPDASDAQDSTSTPTRTPAPNATATATPTATRTPTATLTPSPTEVPIEPTTRLVYDEDTLYIINITEELQDISEVVFVQERTGDDPLDFEATQWQQGSFRGEGSVYALQPESCFQVGLNSGTAATNPDACIRLSSWQQATVQEQFWLQFEDGAEFFSVMLNDEELIACEIAEGVCEFELPDAEE